MFVLLLSGCKKDSKPIFDSGSVYIIGHGAGGEHCHDRYATDRICHNTYPAIREGFTIFQGIEVDVQLSKDTMIYVGHDVFLTDKSFGPIINFLTSEQIDSLNATYDSLHHIVSLEYVFNAFLKAPPDHNRLLSLDVKNYYTTYWKDLCADSCDKVAGQYKETFAIALFHLVNTYPEIKDRLAVEGWDLEQLYFINKYVPDIRYKCLIIVNFTDSIRQLLTKHGYVNCISKSIETTTEREVGEIYGFFYKIHSDNHFLIQLWAATDSTSFKKALNLLKDKGPAIIQADKHAIAYN